jgi:hypothetical protein
VGLALVAPEAFGADTRYQIRRIFTYGETVGGVQTKLFTVVGPLNDFGQFAFSSESGTSDGTLFQYDQGTFTPVLVPGGDAPGGTWPRRGTVLGYPDMDRYGNVVFASGVTRGGVTSNAIWRWDHAARKVEAVALQGMVASDNLEVRSGGHGPAINDEGEIAFVAQVKDTAGITRRGAFFRGRDGQLQTIWPPKGEWKNAGERDAFGVTLNNAGMVMLSAELRGKDRWDVFLWEKGQLTPVALTGGEAPGGGKIDNADWAWLNEKDRSILVGLYLDQKDNPCALYRWADGKLTPVLLPGREMPGGGEFGIKSDNLFPYNFVSRGNNSGRHAFIAMLKDGSTGAYLLEPNGTLSLILKSGMTTEWGVVQSLRRPTGDGYGVGLNNKGEVLVIAKIEGARPMLLLLTPVAP